MDKTFGDGFQIFPARTNLFRFVCADFVIAGGGGDDFEQVGKFLNNFVGGRNEEVRMRVVAFRILDEEAAGTLTEPLNQPQIAGAAQQGVHPIERVIGAAAGAGFGRLGPFVNH